MPELIILRHGHAKTYPPDQSMRGDYDRELKSKGKRNAQRIGVWLEGQGLLPDAVICSSAARAKTTAQKLCKSGGLDEDMISFYDNLYLASPETLIRTIRQTPEEKRRLLLVGHNPGLEILALILSKDPIPRTTMGQIFPPTGMAHLSFNGDWKHLEQNQATLRSMMTPDDLPAMFPYPGPGGSEERPRPAYYYKQSAVIPYRKSENGLEVLIVASSSGKHWVMPKGIHDPGKTAQASATKEAFEEAGVKGVVTDEVVGSYQYQKWDGTCDVQVFAMDVSHELSDSERPESHRARQWVSVDHARERLRNEDLSDVVSLLPGFLNARSQ